MCGSEERYSRVRRDAPSGKETVASALSSSPTAISSDPPPISKTKSLPLDQPSQRRTARNVIRASSSPDSTCKSISNFLFISCNISLPFLASRIADVAKAKISSVLNSLACEIASAIAVSSSSTPAAVISPEISKYS